MGKILDGWVAPPNWLTMCVTLLLWMNFFLVQVCFCSAIWVKLQYMKTFTVMRQKETLNRMVKINEIPPKSTFEGLDTRKRGSLTKANLKKWRNNFWKQVIGANNIFHAIKKDFLRKFWNNKLRYERENYIPSKFWMKKLRYGRKNNFPRKFWNIKLRDMKEKIISLANFKKKSLVDMI